MGKSKKICWKISLAAAPAAVFDLVSTNKGREMFWADQSREAGDGFELVFASGESVTCRVIEESPPESFVFEYFGASRITFTIKPGTDGGTDFEVREANCPEDEWLGNHAGWVAWLYCLKGAADHGVTLRNKSREKTWGKGFVDG